MAQSFGIRVPGARVLAGSNLPFVHRLSLLFLIRVHSWPNVSGTFEPARMQYRSRGYFMRTIQVSTLIVFTCCTALGQSPTPAKAFEVASIKQAPPSTDGRIMVRMAGDAGRGDYNNVSMRDLIRVAFKVRSDQISGPDWLNSERYIVTAKFPAGATRDDVPAML